MRKSPRSALAHQHSINIHLFLPPFLISTEQCFQFKCLINHSQLVTDSNKIHKNSNRRRFAPSLLASEHKKTAHPTRRETQHTPGIPIRTSKLSHADCLNFQAGRRLQKHTCLVRPDVAGRCANEQGDPHQPPTPSLWLHVQSPTWQASDKTPLSGPI